MACEVMGAELQQKSQRSCFLSIECAAVLKSAFEIDRKASKIEVYADIEVRVQGNALSPADVI